MRTSSTTRRGRSPAKHAAILRAATEIFLSEGYSRASIDGIAAAAGVGKQTVYGHFGSKEQLFLAVVDQARSVAGAGPEPEKPHIEASGDPVADLASAGERLLRALLTPDVAALHRLTIAELTHHPALQSSWRESASENVLQALISYLADQDRAGRMTVRDPQRAARHFVLLLATEGRVRSLYGTRALDADEYREISTEVADLVVRAHRR